MWVYVIGIWLLAIGLVFAAYRRELRAIWREPVLRQPVLIIESDDWGAGPVEAQAEALGHLVEVLTRHRDLTGRHPVMTLALVLAVPDGPAIRRDGRYHRLTLEDPIFAPVLAAIGQGRTAGVFALQLHGLEHYWPEALMASADPAVRAWLESDPPASTEQLPPPLQSRWVEASVLPSMPLPAGMVAGAVAEEVRLFAKVFGEKPRVAVPPTFVWTREVEQAWARQGVGGVVTPGLRSACRNTKGLPDCDTGPLRNGQGGEGVHYLVRDDYFEPERGHRAGRALTALADKWAQGRPCLLELHRRNFLGAQKVATQTLDEIDTLYRQALARWPDLRFISTAELHGIFMQRDPAWLVTGIRHRLAVWCQRVSGLWGFWRLARLTGLAVGIGLLQRWASRGGMIPQDSGLSDN